MALALPDPQFRKHVCDILIWYERLTSMEKTELRSSTHFCQVWQWATFINLQEHCMLELQLLAGSVVAASRTFATTLLSEAWEPMNLRVGGGSDGAQVNRYVKLRGISFLGGSACA